MASNWFRQFSSAEIVKGSFEIAYMIAKAKKPHNTGKALIKPCMLKAANRTLGKT